MDLKEREEKYQENLQGRVLSEYVRISNIPIRMKSEFSLMINRIIDLVGYGEKLHEDPYPLTWPRASGIGATTMAISVKVSYPFWTWFITVGKTNLARYNSEHNTHILFIQEKTMRQTDLNKLCLYLRNKIKMMYTAKGKTAPEMRVRRDKLEIKGVGEYDPVILSMRLKINTEDWQGLPLEQLLDIRLRKQKEDGTLALGPLSLPGLDVERESEKEPPEKESTDKQKEKESRNENVNEPGTSGISYSQAVRGQKRSTDEDGFVLPRKVKKTQDKNLKQ